MKRPLISLVVLTVTATMSVVSAFAQTGGTVPPPQLSDTESSSSVVSSTQGNPAGTPGNSDLSSSSSSVNNDLPQSSSSGLSSSSHVGGTLTVGGQSSSRSSSRSTSSSKSSSVSSVQSSAVSSAKKSSSSKAAPAPTQISSSSSSSSSVSNEAVAGQTETGAVLGLSREEFGYSVPVIDPTVIVRPGQFSLEPTAIAGNAFWAILFAVVMGISSVMLKHLIALDEERVRRVLKRLPFQAVFTLFVIWLMHILVPDTFAQGTAAAATVSVMKIPLYALLFFLVVGTSNYVFNNLVGENLENSGVRLWNGTLPDRAWFIIILTLAYGVVGAHINPSFSLFPGQQTGIILIAVATIIFSLCFKDLVMYGLTKKRKLSGRFRANVGGFAIAVMCVVLDRSFALNPGYIYGVPLGLLITSQMFEEREGFFESLSMLWVFAFTVVVWIMGAFLSPYPALFDFMNLLFVLLVEDAFFELLPLPYLTGGAIFSWKKLAWFAQFVVVTFFLFHTLFNPQGTVYNIAQSPPTLSAIMLLGCYAAGVSLLWAYVRWGQGKRTA